MTGQAPRIDNIENNFKEGSFNVSISDRGVTVPTFTMYYVKIGRQVTLSWEAVTGCDWQGTHSYAKTGIILPSEILPHPSNNTGISSSVYAGVAYYSSASTNKTVWLNVNSDGYISFASITGSNLDGAGGTSDTLYAGSATYLAAT